MRVALVGVLIAALGIASLPAQAADGPYTADWNSLKDLPVPAWFDDAKFGIFIHWGGFSAIGYRKGGRGYAEHVPKMLYAEPEHYYPWLDEHFGGHPPEFGYKDILPHFTAEHWDPAAWAALFEEAGAKYVVLTAEHHDGFALWDSDLTEWCATKVGPKRDLVGDLGEAVRALGMKYAPSYHRERHTGFFAEDLYSVASEPRPDIAEEIRRVPAAAGLYGPFDYSDAFIADYVARWKEIQTKYQPDFMWLDDIPIFYKAPGEAQTLKLLDACKGMIADYLNAAAGWGKEVYLNNKGGNPNWPLSLGCLEKDNLQMDTPGPKWENPATMGTSYGYMQAEEEADAYKPAEKLIHLLCDVVSKNGNLLLNIGPKADGTIPEGMQQRLRAMGAWLKVNGEAIYGTRPWAVFGEGIVPEKAEKDDNGWHNINSTGVRYTRSQDGNTVYAILLESPSGEVTLESFRNAEVAALSLLGSNKPISWKQAGGKLRMILPKEKPSDYTCALRIELR